MKKDIPIIPAILHPKHKLCKDRYRTNRPSILVDRNARPRATNHVIREKYRRL